MNTNHILSALLLGSVVIGGCVAGEVDDAPTDVPTDEAASAALASQGARACRLSEECRFDEDCFDGVCTQACGELGVTCDEGADCCGAAECLMGEDGVQRCEVECMPLFTACSADAGCCSGACSAGLCLLPEGATCRLGEECSVGADCFDGVCTQACGELGVTCNEGADCCGAAECLMGDDGIQRCQVECMPLFAACSTDAACCSGACSAGLCLLPEGTTCRLGEECSVGADCFDGVCTQACGGLGVTCNEGADCCGAAECLVGGDGTQRCLVPEGLPCVTHAECEAGALCVDGLCSLDACVDGVCSW